MLLLYNIVGTIGFEPILTAYQAVILTRLYDVPMLNKKSSLISKRAFLVFFYCYLIYGCNNKIRSRVEGFLPPRSVVFAIFTVIRNIFTDFYAVNKTLFTAIVFANLIQNNLQTNIFALFFTTY